MHDHDHDHSPFERFGIDGRQLYRQLPPPPALLTRPAPTAPAKPLRFTRKPASGLTSAEQTEYRGGINRLVATGKLTELVNIHLDMSHQMHGTTPVGAARFLPWHRQYLAAFEEALGSALPYWDWNHGFPAFLDGFLPLTGALLRTFNHGMRLPIAEEIAGVVNVPFLDTDTPGARYLIFSSRLETGLPDPMLPMHNHIHVWVGGTMQTMSSPADPVFWMHHAQVDRLWDLFQQREPDAYPDKLSLTDSTLDPWNVTVADVLDANRLGYRYQ